jgi:uncharacterized membrane protein (UPF0127 family)
MLDLKGETAVLYSRKRRQRQVVRFVDLVVGDALEAPALAFGGVAKSRGRSRTKPVRTTDGSVVCERCTVADSPLPRMRGLLGRGHLPPQEGVLLRPAGSIHTFFMRFPIDVLFLDREGRVVRVVESLPPWRAAAARGARSVLELRAGESSRRGIETGDMLVVGDPA